jgi:pimeloyl-ACP methyl ester carboxylesterase
MEIAHAGRAVYASTGGKPFAADRPSVVFVHGAGMDHTVWALQTRWFAHHGRNVLAIDLPGHGRSAGPSIRSIGAMTDFVLELLDGIGATRVAFVGHSMGALVALEAAARLGERASGLALLGMAPLMPVHPDLRAAAERGDHSCVDLMTTWALGRRAQIGANDAPGLWMTGATLRLLERGDPKSLAADLAACDAYRGAEAVAPQIQCKSLLLMGADDRMTPAAKAAAFAGKLRQCRTVTLPNVGHLIMIEDPAATLAALRQTV